MKSFGVCSFVFWSFLTCLHAKPVDPRFYGNYIGLSIAEIEKGSDFEKSLLYMRVDSEGLHRTHFINDHTFEVSYSPNWLISFQNTSKLAPTLLYKFFAIKQNPYSNLSQSIFYFPSLLEKIVSKFSNLMQFSPFPTYIVEVLGEETPMPLAPFAPNDGTGKRKQGLKILYEQIQKELNSILQGEQTEKTSHLSEIYLEKDLQILKSPNASFREKTQVIERATHNLWTGAEQEIEDRILLLKFAIEKNKDDPKLITHILEQTQVGIAVAGVVPIIVAAIETNLQKQQMQVLNAAIDAADRQLSAAHIEHEILYSAHKIYGTSEITGIHRFTQGKIRAEEILLLDKLAAIQKLAPQRRYSLVYLENLVDVLQKIKAFPNINERILEKTEQSLKNHSAHSLCMLLLQ